MNALTIRRWHSYIGLFIAPSVLFFALTGALQLFNLHEAHDHYRPLALIEKLSSVHKDQLFALGNHPAEPAPENVSGKSDSGKTTSEDAAEEKDQRKATTLFLKAFFLAVALGLTLSAALGLWIGVTQSRSKKTAWLLISAGVSLPSVLLLLQR